MRKLHTKPTSTRRIVLVVLLVAFAGIGTYVMKASQAATPLAALEAEAGTGACTKTVSDSTASGSGAVSFSGCSSSAPGSALNLDITGRTIPDTNYAIPAGAVFMAVSGNDANNGSQAAPVKTITRAINMVPVGGTIVVRAGTYRDGYGAGAGGTYGIANKAFTLQAYPHEQVWFDGTNEYGGSQWTAAGAGKWSMAWSTPGFCENKYYNYKYDAQLGNNTGPCAHYDMYADPTNLAAGDPQMVFINGSYVHEVKTLAEVNASSFFYDWNAKRMYIGIDPQTHKIELATRPVLLVMGGANTVNVKIRGIGVKRYATNEYSNQTGAAIKIYGKNVVVEDSVFTQMAAGGLAVGSQGSIVRHSALVGNGYNGMGSNGSFTSGTGAADNLLIDSNYIANNNTERFGTNCKVSCGQGGVKIAHMNGFTVKNNIFDGNFGHGFWCDLACSGGVIVQNISRGNERSGIIYEASDTGIIASNLVYNNKLEGIRVAAAHTRIYNNTIVNNGSKNIWNYDDPRSPGVNGWTDVGPDSVGTEIVNNIISGSIEAIRSQGQGPAPNTLPDQLYRAYDYNAYYRTGGAGQTLARWLAPGSSVSYTSLSSLTAAKGWEKHGIDVLLGAEPFFVNQSGGNYTVRASSPAYRTGAALPADVAAALGLSAGITVSRGAITWPGQ